MKKIICLSLAITILTVTTYELKSLPEQNTMLAFGDMNSCYHNGEFYSDAYPSGRCPNPQPPLHQAAGHQSIDDPECLITTGDIIMIE